jgi:PTS system nitrogen regulatory IIA component
MDLKLKELAELLQVSTKTIYRWIKEDKIPHYRINHQYRFRTDEINQWATSNKLTVGLNETASEQPVTVLNSLQNGGIYYDIPGSSVHDVLKNAVSEISIPSGIDKNELLSHLLRREELASTGVGNGIAFPHPREPLIANSKDESLTLFFLKNPVDYKAIDNNYVSILFLILSSNQKRHLQLLSQLAHYCRQKDFITFLNSSPQRQDILTYLTN